METDPLRERMERLRELMHAAGGADNIPDEALAEIGYARHYDTETSLTRLLPVERLGGMTVGEYVQVHESAHEADTPPFGRIGCRVETRDMAYDTALIPAELNNRIQVLWGRLWSLLDVDLLQEVTGNDSLLLTYEADASYRMQTPEGVRYLHRPGLPGLLLGKGPGMDGILPTDTDGVYGLLELDNGAESYSTEHLDGIWQSLERYKARLTDVDELEKRIDRGLGNFRFDEDAYLEEDMYQELDPAAFPGDSQAERFAFGLRGFAAQLTDYGFGDVAGQLVGVTSIAEVRKVLAAADGGSAVARDFKQREKALRALRATLTDQEDINQFNRDLQALRAARKAAMAPLRATATYFDLPRLFAQFARREFESVQGVMTRKGHASAGVLELDGGPDAVLDADPGAFSGDCTEGRPLPFGQGVGVHNIKVRLDGKHTGNVYLLATTDSAGRSVWHLDAVQIPAYGIDWERFPAVFTALLATEAHSNEVSAITVNSVWHLISNYDYIGKAFLQYVRAISGGSKISSDRVAEVVFPETSDLIGTSDFQGRGNTQLVLWRETDPIPDVLLADGGDEQADEADG
ncbi:MAG TPA: hypothetical protein VLF40_06465 [Candidatus Saccharimonadales bacterium]|nr:hypothetical protein [Candidatus Saccharimonadales bacterium]